MAGLGRGLNALLSESKARAQREENILLSAKKHEISLDEAASITAKILDFLKITDIKNCLADELSPEMKFKLSLAVIMVYKPLILLIEIKMDYI